MEKKALELYLHIPFCIKKCGYCDFLSAPGTALEYQCYTDELCRRIRKYGTFAGGYHVVSVFLGGGTPSVLEAQQTEKILQTVYESFSIGQNAEITTEVNPGTVTKEKLQVYHRLGINRLSIGLQSADNRELKTLGRIHDYEEFLNTWRMAREARFENINVDLMSAIPGQTLESLEATLRKMICLNPEHLSVYSLIVEEGTPFYEKYRNGQGLPDEETERRMYVCTKELLEEYGYDRYEISNYAREGYECRHNLGYWDRMEYLGIGSGAASLFRRCRFNEPRDLIASKGKLGIESEEKEILSQQEEIEEFFFLGLRKIRGISKARFYECFGKPPEVYYANTIRELSEQGLLKEDEERIWLTDRGLDLSNYVLSKFLF